MNVAPVSIFCMVSRLIVEHILGNLTFGWTTIAWYRGSTTGPEPRATTPIFFNIEPQGCRKLSPIHFRKQSATDGTKKNLNIGVSPGFGGLIQGQIYNPKPEHADVQKFFGTFPSPQNLASNVARCTRLFASEGYSMLVHIYYYPPWN